MRLQETLRARRQAGELPDLLLVLEHPPVYTKGRRTEPADLPMGEDWYRSQGIEVCGHRPRRARDLPRARPARGLPDHGRGAGGRLRAHDGGAIVAALADEGIAPRRARRRSPACGWADAKIGSIGVRVSGGVTTHGLAVNVDNDLQPFEWIVPCGIDHVRMTSVSQETGRAPSLPCFRKRMACASPRPSGCGSGSCPRGAAARARGRWRREHALALQPRRRPRARHGARCARSASASRPGSSGPAPGGPAYRELRGMIEAEGCTRSARRPPARTSASAGSAAPPRS